MIPEIPVSLSSRFRYIFVLYITKSHPKYLGCGFRVTPTGFKPVTF